MKSALSHPGRLLKRDLTMRMLSASRLMHYFGTSTQFSPLVREH